MVHKIPAVETDFLGGHLAFSCDWTGFEYEVNLLRRFKHRNAVLNLNGSHLVGIKTTSASMVIFSRQSNKTTDSTAAIRSFWFKLTIGFPFTPL